MLYLRETHDQIEIIGNNCDCVLTREELRALDLDYPDLPVGMASRLYQPSIRHLLVDTNGGEHELPEYEPWDSGDRVLMNAALISFERQRLSSLQQSPTQIKTHHWPDVTQRTEAVPASVEEMGFFGNIWVRSHYYEKAGDYHEGHEHQFDHVSFLTQGKASVQVGDHETIFTAPAWITNKADQKHKITALEDRTIWWCVFALRDVDGSPLEIFDPAKHSPYGHDVKS